METKVWDLQRGLSIIAEWQKLPGALLPILHAMQAEFGYIDKVVVPMVAKALNLSQAEIHGVISFITIFEALHPEITCSKCAVPRAASPWAARP